MTAPIGRAFWEWFRLLVAIIIFCAILTSIAAFLVGYFADRSTDAGKQLILYNGLAAICAPTGVIPLYGNNLHSRILKKYLADDGILPPLPMRFRVFGLIWGIIGAMCAPALWFRLQEAIDQSPGSVSAFLGLAVWIGGIVVSFNSLWAS